MNWTTFACAGVASAMLSANGAEATKPTTHAARPNIVLMLADDLGYGNLGCYGQSLVATPNIDRLATAGVRFTDAHSSAAVCQPTRYSLLTGMEYGRGSWGRIQAGTYFRDGEVLLPKLLREAGYATAMFGKWHLGFGWAKERGERTNFNQPLTHGPNWVGFDYWFGMANAHNQPPFVFIENERVYKHDPKDPLRVLSKAEADEQGLQGATGWGGSHGAKAAHQACQLDRLDLIMAERAGEWIARQSSDKPFFLYVPFFAPHVPLAVAEEFRWKSPMWEKSKKQNNIVRTADYCGQLDHSVGRILAALKKHGFADNTLVIFTSDNGNIRLAAMEESGFQTNGRYLGQKSDAWEGGHRVPFIAHWPGRIPAGQVTDRLLSTIDLYDTFLAAAGVSKPPGAGVDSLNQLPVLLNPTNHPPVRQAMNYKGRGGALRIGDWVYQDYQGPGGLFGQDKPIPVNFRHSDYGADGKLLPDAPPGQLYNLRADPSQTTNRYREQPELVKAFEALRKRMAADRRSNKPVTAYLPELPADVRQQLGVH